MKRLLTLFFVSVFIAPCVAQQTQNAKDIEEQIKVMEAEIQKYKEILENTQNEHSELESNLEKTEKTVNDLQKEIQTIESALETGRDKVSRLESKQKELQRKKTSQQHFIEQQIQAAYKTGKQEYLKLVLNQEDPVEVSRMLTYYDYLNKARVSEVEKFRDTIAQLALVTEDIAEENTILEQNRITLDAQRTHLQQEKDQKRLLLQALNRQLSATGSELTKLADDRQRLEQLLLRIQAAELPVEEVSTPFDGMKGQLLLPVAGKVSHSFGATRNTGKMRWRGIFIDAPEGEPVHAVHYGRVVFSDWLRGFGLLMIVNHGEGYMSLYGHNQMIYREAGDWVIAGETIATVGDTGGQNRTGLYFEIRIDGTPADPQLWCQARSSGAA